MTNDPHEWILRVKSVEKEYQIALIAIDRFRSEVMRDVTILSSDIRVRDVRRTIEQLEGTYIIRMFAEFETSLRKFWNRHRPAQHKKQTPAEILVDHVGSQISVPDDAIAEVHRVRESRNLLIHEREGGFRILSIGEVRSRLCRFLYCLHGKWT